MATSDSGLLDLSKSSATHFESPLPSAKLPFHSAPGSKSGEICRQRPGSPHISQLVRRFTAIYLR